MPIHQQSNMSDSDLKFLFPSFELKLARILHTTLDVPREAHNHLCEALILAKSTTWDWFITDIIDYGYVADLEYHVQTGYRSITGCNWYDHNQYTQDVFLAFCDTRDRSPGLAAIQNKANAMIPLAPLPPVTKVPLASQPSEQAKPCLTKPVLSQASSTTTTYVSKTTPALASSMTSVSLTSTCETPVISTIANNGNTLGSRETHKLARPNTDLPASTSTPSHTWTYFPCTESVCFRRIVSSTIPTVHPDTPPGDASHTTPKRHPPRPSPQPSANTTWTFHPKSATVTVRRSPKQFSSHKPSTCNPLLRLLPSGALSKNSAVPSSVHAKDSAVPNSVHAYSLYGASSCLVQKPTYGAHSLTFDLSAVCITKRHRDAIKLKLYHLHATLLLANWLYDALQLILTETDTIDCANTVYGEHSEELPDDAPAPLGKDSSGNTRL
eukprot:jgi/Psemu1/41667/gm1.41667_g